MGVPGGPPPPGGPWGAKKQEKERNERWVHLDGSLPVRYHCVTGNLWPAVEHESMTGHLPHSCLEMKMNKLSAERTDPRWNKTWGTVIVNMLSHVGDKDVRDCDSLSWCSGLAMDLFRRDPWKCKQREWWGVLLSNTKTSGTQQRYMHHLFKGKRRCTSVLTWWFPISYFLSTVY